MPFVFAEVNADRVTWMVFADGSKKKISTDSVSVGQNISTKAVGSDKRVDITANYKYAEGWYWMNRESDYIKVELLSIDFGNNATLQGLYLS